jgi:bidirectional [NiFe] hydrogenase diaphorase subunit
MDEGKQITFTIDGQTVTADPGETVLSVAKRCGIEIPALCHHEAVAPYGACRLCVVEAFWGKRSKLVTSCIYTPWADERIETNNDRVRRARKMTLELILARAPGAETVRKMAREYGVEEPRFSAGPGEADENRCILCGLCVRVCAESVGQNAIGYANRGTRRVISTPFGKNAEECIGCGACVFVCPTDALHYDDIDGKRVMRELNTSVPMVACRVCGDYFAAVDQMAKLRQRWDLPDELAETCPECRGTEFRETLERHLFSKGASKNTTAAGQIAPSAAAWKDEE